MSESVSKSHMVSSHISAALTYFDLSTLPYENGRAAGSLDFINEV